MKLEILVVDDSRTDRQRMAKTIMVAIRDARVHEAADGREAIRLMESRPFDVLLTDQHMGQVDGLRVLQEARRLRPEMRRIMITNDDDLKLVQEALRLGRVHGYLLKRWSKEQIHKELTRLASAPTG